MFSITYSTYKNFGIMELLGQLTFSQVLYLYIIFFRYISFFVFLHRIVRYALTSSFFNLRLETTSVIFKRIFFVIRMKALDARNFCRQENICILEIRCFYTEPTKLVSLLKITGLLPRKNIIFVVSI